jgi:hypothetical protein
MRKQTTNGGEIKSVEIASDRPMIETIDFDTSVVEYAQFTIRMPKSWDEGTVTFMALWSHAATSTDFGVCWGLHGVAIGNNESLNTAFGGGQAVIDTGGTTNNLYHADESGPITIGNSPSEGDWVCFRVERQVGNGSDNLAIDARLHGIALFYTTNTATDA